MKKRSTQAPKPTAMVFTDASRCHLTGAAGWGAWVKRDGGASEVFGAAFGAPMASPNDAEVAAIANALKRALNWRLIEVADVVMIQSDSLDSLRRIREATNCFDSPAKGGLSVAHGKRPARLSPVQIDAIAAIRSAVQVSCLTLVVRHVKGHTQGGGRNWVNREVRPHRQATHANAPSRDRQRAAGHRPRSSRGCLR